MDYIYNLSCFTTGFGVALNCSLRWEYSKVSNETSSYWTDYFCGAANNDLCLFDINLGDCGNRSIECKNGFGFANGYPTMWACLDNCHL